MNIRRQLSIGARVSAVAFALAAAIISPRAAAATDGVNGVTITSINLYAGTHLTGAFIFFSPAKPAMGGCANAAGNAVWIDWTSTIQPDGKAL